MSFQNQTRRYLIYTEKWTSGLWINLWATEELTKRQRIEHYERLYCSRQAAMHYNLKSKSAVNCVFILWKTGSCAVAWARLASDSEAALLNVDVTTLATLFSTPTPKVLTNLQTKLWVCGVTAVSAMLARFSKATARHLARPWRSCLSTSSYQFSRNHTIYHTQ